MNLPYILGFIAGIASVAIIITLINKITKKKYGKFKGEYDERQHLLRGKAYKAAYFTLLGYIILDSMIVRGLGIEWARGMTDSLIGLFISVGVFVIICINNDAYISVREKPITYIAVFAFIGILNIGICVINLQRHESMVTDGMLNESAINLACGILFIVLAAALAIKVFKEKLEMKRDGDA